MLGRQRAGGEGVFDHHIYGARSDLLPWWAVQFRRGMTLTARMVATVATYPIIGWLIIIAFNCQNGTPRQPPAPTRNVFPGWQRGVALKRRALSFIRRIALRYFPQARAFASHTVAPPCHNNIDFAGRSADHA